MKSIIALCILSVFLGNIQAIVIEARIFDGIKATDGELPYQVVIQNRGTTNYTRGCGGTLITPKHILTAGHCVANVCFSKLTVLAGQVYVRETNESSIVRIPCNVTMHPNYRETIVVDPEKGTAERSFDDIAIVELEDPIPDDSQVAGPIPLNREDPEIGTSCVISGFGRRFPQSPEGLFEYLYYTKMQLVERERCEKDLPNMQNEQICAVGEGKTTGPCRGDSGGPLVCNGKLVGVISMASCGDNLPSIFVNVKDYIPWIESTIANSGYSIQ